jgi:hypothetical protein
MNLRETGSQAGNLRHHDAGWSHPPAGALGATLLYSNDFESPAGFVDTTGKDVSQQTVDSLYSLAGFQFQQTFTVETLHITGGVAFGTGYSDPAGTGGSYALGMLSSVQNDLAALTFDIGSFSFLNVGMDISAIDLDGVGGPFGVAQPIFRLRLYDTPSGSFSFASPGTLLSTVDVTGTGAPDRQVFSWTSVVGALDASSATNGNVTLVVDLIQSGYASFDNLVIAASNTPGDVPEPGAAWLLLGTGLVALGTRARRRP